MNTHNKISGACFKTINAVLTCAVFQALALAPTNANAQYQKDYINTVLPWAQQAHALYGVPISVAIAQSAKESGWYVSTKTDNDYFNIGGAGPDTYSNGTNINGWGTHKSGSDAFLGYGYFVTHGNYFIGLSGNKIDCRIDINNPLAFLHDLAIDGFDGGPNSLLSDRQAYNDIVASIISYNNLTQYDQATSSDTEIWVDGGYSGAQSGTQANPYSTVGAAVLRANGSQPVLIHIKPGTYGEKIGTNKHIHFVTNGSGVVRIGG